MNGGIYVLIVLTFIAFLPCLICLCDKLFGTTFECTILSNHDGMKKKNDERFCSKCHYPVVMFRGVWVVNTHKIFKA